MASVGTGGATRERIATVVGLQDALFARELGYKNAKSYGAQGDGVADDTAAIQSAIDDLESGDTLYFPIGVYMSNRLYLRQSGVSIRGGGRNSVLKLIPQDFTGLTRNDLVKWGGVLTIAPVTGFLEGIHVSDMTFDGSRGEHVEMPDQAPDVESLEVGKLTKSSFVRCWFLNAHADGLDLDWCFDTMISQCYASGCGKFGFHMTREGSGQDSRRLKMSNCVAIGNGGGRTTDLTNYICGGADIWYSHDSSVSDCIFEGNDHHGLVVGNSSGTVVLGNTIVNSVADGLHVLNNVDTLISANVIRESGANGISILGISNRVTIRQNRIQSSVGDGVFVDEGPQNLQIVGNNLVGAGGDIVSSAEAIPMFDQNFGIETPFVPLPGEGLLDRLSNYYPLDEASGTSYLDEVTQLSGTGSDARIAGGDGILGDCADFGQGDDYITTNILNIPNRWGISFWVRFNTVSGDAQAFYSGSPDPETDYFITEYAPGQARLNIWHRSESTATRMWFLVPWSPATNTWYHIAITRDGDTTTGIKCWIDGQSVTATANTLFASQLPIDLDSPLVLGARRIASVYDRFLNGRLDEFGFWRRALVADDVTELYGDGTPPAFGDFD
jgi:parallel beta-helix repeat protein